jgi:isoamylase
VELLLFEKMDAPRPERVITLNPGQHRTYHYWHVFVPDLKTGQIYGYRMVGPWAPEKGARFDPGKVLLDPYGRALAVPPVTVMTWPAGRGKTPPRP